MADAIGQDVSRVINEAGISTAIDNVVKKIVGLEQEISKVNEDGINVRVDLTGADSLVSLSRGVAELKTLITGINPVIERNAVVSQQMTAVTESLSGSTEEYSAKLRDLQSQLAAGEKKWSEFGRSNAAVNASFKESQDQIKAKIEALLQLAPALSQVNNTINIQTNVLNDQATSLSKVRQQMVQLVIAGKELTPQFEELMQQALLLSDANYKVVQSTQSVTKETEAETIAFNRAWEQGVIWQAQQVKMAEAKTAAFNKAWDEGEKWQIQEQISSVKNKNIIDARTARETKAFNIAWEQGERWQAQQVKMAAGGASIWDKFGNIFERMGLRMVASLIIFQGVIEGLSALWEWYNRAGKAAKEYADALKQVDDNVAASALGDKQKASEFIAIARDSATAMGLRIDAVKKLQDLYPNYFKNLSQEAIMTGDITTATEALTKALLNKALMEANYDKAKIAAKKYSDAQDELDNAKFRRGNLAGDPLTPVTQQNLNQIKQGDEKIKEIEKEQAKWKAEIDKYNKLGDDYAIKAAGVLVKDPKDKKGRNRLDPSLSGEKELIEAKYNLRKQELTQVTETQKAIVDDEKKALQERLNANTVYQGALIELAANEYEKTKKLEELKIRESKNKENEINSGKGNYTSGQRSLLIGDENKKQAAAGIDIKAALQKYYDEYTKITIAGLTKTQQVINEYNENWVKGQELSFAEQKNIEMQGYLISEQVLKDMLDHKLLSITEYNKKIRELKTQELILANEVEQKFDREMLNSGKLTDSERKKYEERIAALEKQLAQLKGGKVKDPDKDWNLTDPIVDALNAGNLSDDDPKLLEAKKQFWGKSVDLAKAAYDSIQTIRDNQFKAEEQQIQIKMQQVELQSQQQIQAIEASAGFAITKSNEESKVAAQAAAQENALQQQENQATLKKAKGDKTAAELGIVASTSEAIIKTIAAYAAIPGGFAIAAGLSGVIAAIGAAQYAAAASTPLPQFAEGVTGFGGGKAILGDGYEKEFVSTPHGSFWSDNKPTVYDLPKGTDVTPMSKMIDYAQANVAGSKHYDMQAIYNNDVVMKEVAKIIGDKLVETGSDTVRAIYSTATRKINNTVIIKGNNLQRK